MDCKIQALTSTLVWRHWLIEPPRHKDDKLQIRLCKWYCVLKVCFILTKLSSVVKREIEKLRCISFLPELSCVCRSIFLLLLKNKIKFFNHYSSNFLQGNFHLEFSRLTSLFQVHYCFRFFLSRTQTFPHSANSFASKVQFPHHPGAPDLSSH